MLSDMTPQPTVGNEKGIVTKLQGSDVIVVIIVVVVL